jgi:hypothetical protein
MNSERIQTIVKDKYGAAVVRAASGVGSACCGTSPSSSTARVRHPNSS